MRVRCRLKSKPDYRSQAAKKILESEGGSEEPEEKKSGKLTLLDELEFGGTGLDEAPEDPANYGIGE